MFRSILGFALLAVVAFVALSLVLSLLGFVVSVAVKVLWLAALGFLFYLALRVISPRTADRLREMIKGRPSDAA
ncbi:MAG: hypothetical protein ACREME_04110 [Gemmatimonadales bacterium]